MIEPEGIDSFYPGRQPIVEESARVRQGANPLTPAAVLEKLAGDPAVVVRAALALNPSLPPAAVGRLAADEDERVRMLVARRLAAMAPALSGPDQRFLEAQAVAALTRLVADEAIRVRAAIADVVKEMPDAPHDLILRLARDCAVSVSQPIILFSPVLTEADLLVLLEAPHSAETVASVARRPGLTVPVADAIALAEDSDAIRALLANESAQIREATLDALIARAADHADWHEPLVTRPKLSAEALRRLAEIVATEWLRVLAGRADLPPHFMAELRARLLARLAEERTRAPRVPADLSTERALSEAHRLARTGALNEAGLAEALRTNRPRLAAAMLAVAAVVPISVVDRAAALRNSRGLVSLLWSAGFKMPVAGLLQRVIGNVPPASMLQPTADGGFPLTAEEMRWQVDFLRRAGG